MSRKLFVLCLLVSLLLMSGSMNTSAQTPANSIIRFNEAELSKVGPDLLQPNMLILYEGQLNTITKGLGIDKPKVYTKHVVKESAVYIRNNQIFLAQLILADENQDIVAAEADWVALILETADKVAGPQRQMQQKPSYFMYEVFLPQVTRGGAYWLREAVIITSVSYCPYGQFNDVVVAQKVNDEYDTGSDYWGVQLQQQILPGHDSCPDGGPWYSVEVNNIADVVGTMYRYGPYSTSNQQSVTVGIGFDSKFNLGWSWSFPILDVKVIDHTNYSIGRLQTEFQITYGSPASAYTYVSEPGISVITQEARKPALIRALNLAWMNFLGFRIPYTDQYTVEY